MKNIKTLICAAILLFTTNSFAWVKGIYLTQYTAENTKTLKYLIQQAKSTGINTFVIDYSRPSKRYTQNIQLVKAAGISYVARIVMFPDGGEHAQIISQDYINKRIATIQQAVALGASAIQLDYIRYKASQRPSPENAKNVLRVIQAVNKTLDGSKVNLQVDIFGVAANGDSLAIGQSPSLFATVVDAICPMVYPSHYEPFRIHAVTPYQTVLHSLNGLRQNLRNSPNVKIYAYIELFNYRFPMSHATKIDYIMAQLRAVRDSQADGYYVWSANNKYDILFSILRSGRPIPLAQVEWKKFYFI